MSGRKYVNIFQNKADGKMEIKFVSYTGAYPNLCSGVLTLEINGEIVKFGSDYDNNCHYLDQFWESGGSVWFGKSWTAHVTSGEWVIHKTLLPMELQPYKEVISNLFNDNVPHGCCGGCV